jgi:hypothetical protein
VRPVSRRIEVGILAFNRGLPVSGRNGVSFGDFFSVGFVDFVLLQGLLLVVLLCLVVIICFLFSPPFSIANMFLDLRSKIFLVIQQFLLFTKISSCFCRV